MSLYIFYPQDRFEEGNQDRGVHRENQIQESEDEGANEVTTEAERRGLEDEEPTENGETHRRTEHQTSNWTAKWPTEQNMELNDELTEQKMVKQNGKADRQIGLRNGQHGNERRVNRKENGESKQLLSFIFHVPSTDLNMND